MNQEHHWYFIGLFDVLGFETKFARLGLSGMAELYDALIGDVNAMNAHAVELEQGLALGDEAIWTADGDAFVFNRVNGAYASDSIVLWAHAHFAEARALSQTQRVSRASDPAKRWMYHFIPCDRFLDACNQLLCHALEIGLPLRGALALGPGIVEQQRRVFLGQPMIDAARAEKGQKIIGAAFTPSFLDQVVPTRFGVPFKKHIKADSEPLLSEYVLDWPRHWRRTRSEDLRGAVDGLNQNAEFATYYENTQQFIDASEARSPQRESLTDWSIRTAYPQFSSPELKLKVHAVRSAAQQIIKPQPR
jgi:hypothetical protein